MNQHLYQVLSVRTPNRLNGRVREDGNHYIGIHPDGHAFIYLNRLAGEIYHLIDSKKTVDDIVMTISKKYYSTSLDQIKKDVCRCLAELDVLKLINFIRREEG